LVRPCLGLGEAQGVTFYGSELQSMQVLEALGGKYFLGVNYSAMHKYPAACSPAQWQNAAASVKVSCRAPLAPSKLLVAWQNHSSCHACISRAASCSAACPLPVH